MSMELCSDGFHSSECPSCGTVDWMADPEGFDSRERVATAILAADRADLARLRRIEEAARDARVELDIVRAHHPYGGPYTALLDASIALCAALEAER